MYFVNSLLRFSEWGRKGFFFFYSKSQSQFCFYKEYGEGTRTTFFFLFLQMSVQNTVTSPNLHCRSLYSVLSPMFVNRNAQWLSLLNTVTDGDGSTHVSLQLCMDAHTQHHISISQQQKGKCSLEYQFYSLWFTGGEEIFQYVQGSKSCESVSNNYKDNLVNRKITPTKTS